MRIYAALICALVLLGTSVPVLAADEDAAAPPEALPPDAADASLPEAADVDVPPGMTGFPTIIVREVRVIGNSRVEAAAVRAVLKTTPGTVLDPETVAADLKRVFRLGFFEDARIELAGDPADGLVVVSLKEKPLISKVTISGNKELKTDKIKEVVDVRRGEILSLAKVKRNVEKIREKYIDEGYYLAEVLHETKTIGDTVEVAFKIIESAKVKVKNLTFVGNKALKDKELKEVMATKEGDFLSFVTGSGKFNEKDFEEDLFRITARYYDIGYINVNVGKPVISLGRNKKSLYITVHVEEGARYRVGKVGIGGKLLDEKKETLEEKVSLTEGAWFSRTALGKDVMGITRIYRDKGYAYCNVEPVSDIDTTDRIVSIRYEVDPGKPVTFHKIEVRGNTRTRDKVIRERLVISEGDLYSETGIEISRSEVTRLGFFEEVNLSTTRGPADNLINVVIEVKEKATGTFQVGAGFSSVEKLVGTAQVQQDNLFGRGQSLTLTLAISARRQQFNLRFIEPRFLGTKLRFSFDAFITERVLTDFSTTTRGGALSLGYQFTRDFSGFVRYSLFDVGLKSCGYLGCDLEENSLRPLFRDGFTSSVTVGAVYETLNNRLFPSSGFQNNISVEFADRYIGSEIVFTKLRAAVRWYYPIVKPKRPGGGVVFSIKAKMGAVFSNGVGDVGLSERFYEGGIGSIRGFDPRSLGPLARVAGGDPGDPLRLVNIGGTFSFVTNVELEFPILEAVGIRGVLFFDAGNAFGGLSEVEDVNIIGSKFKASRFFDFAGCVEPTESACLRTSVGFGIRWFSPIGPLRFEWGFPLKKDPLRNERTVVFEFTIGNFF